ncbi:MAG: CHAP domain-containing protein [Oscillibacter sp.]|nr:CHAP domain-containing protein [Oscillibacter sp.]
MGKSNDPLKVAQGELGNTESPAGSNRTKYGKWMGLDGQPWCMSFVQYCFAMAGYPLPYKTGSCSALLSWYRKNKPECIVTAPKARDIVIYNFGHTGILESAAADTVTVVEGNTSASAAGSQDNGGGVFTRTRSKTLVQAFIRPFENYEEDDEMVYYKTLNDVPESYRATISKLMEKGALKGHSDPDPSRLDDNVLDISGDMCRVLKVLDNLGKLD